MKKKSLEKDIYCAALILAIAACFMGPSLFPGNVFGPYDLLRYQYPWGLVYPTQYQAYNPEPEDFIHQVYPWRHFLAESLKQGEAPLWNPHQLCGTPFAANDQSAIFYPLNLLFALMPAAAAIGISALLHLFMAGFFMFLFMRLLGLGRVGAIAGGIAFMLTGWNVIGLAHPGKLDAAIWAPLVFLFFELALSRSDLKWKLLCGLILGVQFTAGFLQVSAYTVYGLAIYGAARWLYCRKASSNLTIGKLISALAVPGIVSIAFSAVHVFQVFALVPEAQRSMLIGKYGFFASGIPYRMLITALIPNFFGNPVDLRTTNPLNYTELCCFAGAAVLCFGILALITRGRGKPAERSAAIALAVVAAVGLISAPGTPLYIPFYYLFPGAKFLAVNRIIFLFMFGTAGLYGFGVDAIIRGTAVLAESVRAAVWLLLFAAAGLVAIYLYPGYPPVPDNNIPLESILVFAAIVICIPALTAFRKYNIKLSAVIAIFILMFDLFVWGVNYNNFASKEAVFPSTPSIEFLKAAGKRFNSRIQSYTYNEQTHNIPVPTLFPNTAMVYGLDDIRGYDSLLFKRYQDFIGAVHSQESSLPFNRSTIVNTNALRSKWVDFLNVRYVISSAPFPSGKGYALSFYAEGDLPIYRNKNVLPRGMTIRRWQVFKNSKEILPAMMSPDFNPAEMVALEEMPPGLPESGFREVVLSESGLPAPPPKNAESHKVIPAIIVNKSANSIEFQAAGQGLLVMSETYAPGWQATVDGKPAPVLRADYTFRAVPLPTPGIHTVRLEYRPMSATIGLGVSSTAVLIGLVLVLLSFIKRNS